MTPLSRIPSGMWIVLGTLFLAAGAYWVRGDSLFSPGALQGRPRESAMLGGVRSHAELANRCTACHEPFGSDFHMGSRCLLCHVEIRSQIDQRRPLHGRLSQVENCRTCHTEHRGTQAALTNFDRFDHEATDFPLTGKHLAIACVACHVGHTYQGAPRTCVACHAEPKVHLGRFGADCAKCHATTTWHATQLHHFDHNLADFKLTGKHLTTGCAACHKNQVYRGTSKSCADCHAEPKAHAGRFGRACATCHSTASWYGASVSVEFHRFPIDHGGGKNRGACSTCHQSQDAYRSYTCYGCHRHDPAKTAEKHRSMNVFDLAACAKCHPTARKRPDQPAKVKEPKADKLDQKN